MVQILRITNRQASAIREPTAHTSDRHSTTIQVKKNRWGKDVRVTVHKRSSPLQWLVVSCNRIRLCLSLCYYKAHFSLQWYDVQAQIPNIYQLPSSPPPLRPIWCIRRRNGSSYFKWNTIFFKKICWLLPCQLFIVSVLILSYWNCYKVW